MEKRVLLAVVLSFVVLYAYQALVEHPKPAPNPPAAAGSAAPVTPDAGSGTAASAAAPVNAQPPVEAPAVTPAAPARVSDTEERDIVVESEAVRAVFTTRGGVLKSWRLKKYKDEAGGPLDMVPHRVPPGTQSPFALAVPDQALTTTLQQALFKPNTTALTVANEPATLTFDYESASGLVAHKAFTFAPDQPYVVSFSASVEQGGTEIPLTVHGGPGIGSGLVTSTRTYNPPPQPIFYRDKSVSRITEAKVPENASQDGVFGFAGVDDHYFITTIVGPLPLHLDYRTIDVPVDDKVTAHFIDWSARFPSSPRDVRFFLGPKGFEALSRVDRDLVRAIHFGIFAWLVVPLLRALNWVNGYVGNYGWSIIVLTVLINVVMFPLRHKSVVSMRRMQEIQPEVKSIQDRYAKLKMTDPARQKMNTEMMNLYRERGVNPASGCVPMLLTMPVLLAFYAMLTVAIELRGAPFVGWIHDLSVHDPLFITPVLMGATQFVQTKMTPSTADPMQQKMMMFMPLIFMTMFIWAPSGLVLYWTTSNLWAIGQQAFTNRLIGPTPQRTVRPPAERKVKNVGGGKSEQASKEQK